MSHVIDGPGAKSGAALTATVVVATRDRSAFIGDAVRALLHQTYPRFEVLVIDQSSNELTRRVTDELARGDCRLRYARTDTVGLSVARNAGARISSADVIAYIDDDCLVGEGWLAALMEEFAAPEVTGVYGMVTPHGLGRRTGLEAAVKESPERTVFTRRIPPWHIGHGANMAFRRTDLLRIGGFDPLLGAGGLLKSNEDGDMAHRLLRAHRLIVYTPAAVVYHRQWRTWPSRQETERGYGIGAGAQFAKYIRSGDLYGWRLLWTWIWQLGVRRIGAGLLKWRSSRVMYLGYCQLIYPWIGIWRSLRYAVDPQSTQYVS